MTDNTRLAWKLKDLAYSRSSLTVVQTSIFEHPESASQNRRTPYGLGEHGDIALVVHSSPHEEDEGIFTMDSRLFHVRRLNHKRR